ncbi:tetratricopeptide repeat-containing diguanylate cyclase [Shewanella benthica]|uniref:diguanylate cyclase n=1 Tax=Shewanella benthica KT99 TaxID=314608 RepID=A9D366_9GAMM|nr:GGDEF domain-containing protein [Shewanella benthica]EDQ01622.1 GGDEF family protein [Shewanella benthica KT99]
MQTFKLLLLALLTFIVTSVAAAKVEGFDGLLDDLENFILDADKSNSLIENLVKSQHEFNLEQHARFLVLQGTRELINGKYQSSIVFLNEAEKLQPSTLIKTSIFLHKATIFVAYHEYQQALDIISLNSSLVEKLKDVELKAKTYIRLAGLYSAIQAFDEVKQYALKVVKLGSGISLKNQCHAKLYLAVSELKLGILDNASRGFEASSQFCRLNGFLLIDAMSIKGLGMVELEKGNYSNANLFFIDALLSYQPFQYMLEINHIYALLSESYLGLKKIEKAKEYAEIVIELPDEPSNLEFKKRATKVLAEIYNKRGDFELAYQYMEKYQGISTALLDDTKAKANAYQMAKFENGEKNREINLLNKDRELYTAKAALTESKRRNERMMNTLIFGGLVVLAIFALVMTVQKRKYKQLAQYDALTGIFNRGTAQNIAEYSFIKTASKREMFSVIMFDLDHFKRINDNYGHGTGDWILKKVAEVINKASRSDDVFARFGSEEFALFLPNTDEAKAKIMAEEYRGLIQSIETRFSGHNFAITASFGVSTSSEDDLSLDPLLHRADIAMYHSKEQGRNCVTLYKPEIEQSRSGYQKSKMALR